MPVHKQVYCGIFTAYAGRVRANLKNNSRKYGLFSLNYAQDADDLEFILKRLKKTYKEWGLTINFNKTKIIAIY